MGVPASVVSDGTRRVLFVPAIANVNALTVSEVTSSDNVSCHLTSDGWSPTKDQATVTDSRLCSTQDFEGPGRETASLTIRYVFNLGDPTQDEARLALTKGTKGYLVVIYQRDSAEEGDLPEAGDFAEVWPVTMGRQNVLPAEANSVDRIEQRAFVTGPVTDINPIVA